ncbi:probable small intestine urate exporter [Pteronotus mesoamericanus]|uniref:probable small intestine urate exporter n=1 Tax=Pteronotus mesoamericanus TaxID=1884717 RepID=UPI0023ECA544|nr:probable small intestine urate exporter [Pteronotus parnellii mesoamericanus]XP_054420856.1 probable small intestine urate exporter [Pteronotus parnellii mesoamericanus]XP_054420857.1 probable small intestine urate exporter [Pteronotus parnellii mesoamericanus]
MSTRAEAMATRGEHSGGTNVCVVSPPAATKGFCSVRHGLAFLLHFCNFAMNAQNTALNITLPAMVNASAPPCPANTSDARDACNETLLGRRAADPVYDWSPYIQGVILGSFNYGSFLASIPSGYVAGIFGAKYLIGTGLFVSSVLNFFVPWAADTGVALLIVLRAVQGVSQGMIVSSQYVIWINWAPPLERNQLISISASGSMLGSCTVLLAGGFLCETLGWTSVFYIFGGTGCACACLWFSLVYEDPAHHPFISAGERDYIVHSLAQQDHVPSLSLPIKAMIKSLPLWSIMLSIFCVFWHAYVILTYTPMYLHTVLELDFKDSGFLSAMVLGATYIYSILVGMLADTLLSRKILSLIVLRRLFTAIGVSLAIGFSVFLPWVSDSLSVTMAFLVLSFTSFSFCQVGSFVNFMDLAPRYTGVLKGLSQFFSQLSGVLAPTVSGFLISQDSESGWRNIFLLSAVINIPGLLFFLAFSRVEVQDWARDQPLTRL